MMFWKEAKDKVLCLLDWWTFGSYASFQNMAIFGFMPPQLVARWEYFPAIRIGTLMYNCFWICFIFMIRYSAMYHLIMCKFISVVCTLKYDTIWRRTPRFGYELNKKYTQKWFEILFGIDSSNFIFYPFGPGPPPPLSVQYSDRNNCRHFETFP